MMANRDYGDDDAVIIAASTLLLGCAAEEGEVWQSKRKKRTVWVKPWLALREKFGAYQALVLEFTDTETDEYHRFMRMDHDTFMVIFYLCPRDRGQIKMFFHFNICCRPAYLLSKMGSLAF